MTPLAIDEDPFGDQDPFEIYDDLFSPLEEKFGALDDDVLSSPMLMFGMSFCKRQEIGLYVTYEPFHLIETESKEGLKFAVFMAWARTQSTATDFLTEFADWILENRIGDGDVIDVSGFETKGLPSDSVRISLFSNHPESYGIYEVRFVI